MTQKSYEIEGNTFRIIDEELELELEGELEFLDKGTYPSGQTRYETYRKGDKLHGPSYFYGKDGGLISEAWFYDGIAMGKVKRYYTSGDLYCIERFVEGVFHKLQEYYYPDGSVKTQIPFKKGKLDGVVCLYWPGGALKREATYAIGVCISDQIYDEKGEKIVEASRALS